MSFLSRSRPLLRNSAARFRSFATATTEASGSGAGADFIKQRQAIEHHAAKSAALWRKITIYVAFPAIVVGYLNALNLMKEHESHVEHMKEENGGELPERIRYSYFNKRDKEFPWGNHTLFFNPEVNIDPDVEE